MLVRSIFTLFILLPRRGSKCVRFTNNVGVPSRWFGQWGRDRDRDRDRDSDHGCKSGLPR
jgi:hypothetical protein